MKINKLVVDSTNSITDLCALGAKHQTDKSPYNTHPNLHKHAYTAIYDLLFSHLRYSDINIAEIGILDNKSMLCWRNYFTNAKLFGFEWFDDKIDNAKSYSLNNTSYYKMNIKDEQSIINSLDEAGVKYNIVIEDSTHEFSDQIRFINLIPKYLLPGSILVIEDIFRSADEKLYEKQLESVAKYFSSATFIMAEHEKKFSPGWDNDKLLILHRNDVY